MSFDPFGTFRSASRASSCSSAAATAPATGKVVPWHERRAWKRTGVQLLRYYAKRSDYSFRLRPGQAKPLACVDPKAKRVEVTTTFPEAKSICDFAFDSWGNAMQGMPRDVVRHHSLLRDRPTETWLKGFIAHEAGHILFSRAKPEQKVLGWLWNTLEDERMERLTAGRYDELYPIFDVMGDVMLSESPEEKRTREKAASEAQARHDAGDTPDPQTVLGACLDWRWLWDHAGCSDTPEYHPKLVAPRGLFENLRPLIERAWEAENSDEVTEIAREILATYDIPEDTELPEGLPAGDVPFGQAAGGDEAAPEGEAAPGESSSGEEEGPDPDEPGKERSPGEEEPEMPEIDPHGESARAGADLLAGVATEARSLSQALRPQQKSRLRTPHRSRGRFEYRRYAQGRSRVFTRKPTRPEPPAFLTVLLDLSFSMTWGERRLESALKATALLSAATEMAGTHMRVIPFKEEPGPALSTLQVSHETLRAALSTVEASDGTRLAPALRAACEGTPAKAGRHVVVLITDGNLDDEDAEQTRKAQRKLSRGPGAPLVLPLLIGEAAAGDGSKNDPARAYKSIFARHAAVADVAELASVAARWIKAST